jgi:hypothetical protein
MLVPVHLRFAAEMPNHAHSVADGWLSAPSLMVRSENGRAALKSGRAALKRPPEQMTSVVRVHGALGRRLERRWL